MTTRAATIPVAAGLCALLLLGGCAATEEAEDASAFRDFIEVTDLQSARAISTFGTLGGLDHEILDDEYLIVSNRDQDYLLEYVSRCDEDPFTRRVKADVRSDANRIYAGIDTYRGCRIKALYELTPDQVVELRNLGMAPGEKPRKPQ